MIATHVLIPLKFFDRFFDDLDEKLDFYKLSGAIPISMDMFDYDDIEDDEEYMEEEDDLVGHLKVPLGIRGYKTAEIGHRVFEKGDRYVIKLESESEKKEILEVPYYKHSLKESIDFIIWE